MSTYLFGPHAVEDALRAKRQIEVIYIAESRRKKDIEKLLSLAKELNIKVQFVPIVFFKQVASDQNIPHQGVAAKSKGIKIHEFKDWIVRVDINSNPIVVLVDHIEDPHNFGAIIRSAAAFGVGGFIFPKDRNATFGSGSERAAAGGQNHVQARFRFGPLRGRETPDVTPFRDPFFLQNISPQTPGQMRAPRGKAGARKAAGV